MGSNQFFDDTGSKMSEIVSDAEPQEPNGSIEIENEDFELV